MKVTTKAALLGGLALMPIFSFAYTYSDYSAATPDDEVWFDDRVTGAQWFAGELQDNPHMYSLQLTETTEIVLQLRTGVTTEGRDFSLLLVRDNEPRGVELVKRVSAQDMTWREGRDRLSRVRYIEGVVLTEELPVGVYRAEVSTPLNNGEYWLVFGEGAAGSWREKWQTARAIQQSAGVSGLAMLFSPLLIWPLTWLVITVLVIGIVYRRYKTLVL